MLELWEFHPMLVHFPIAFLTGAVGVFLFNSWKKNSQLNQFATGILIAGTVFGWLAAFAGGLAYLTVPAHTEEGHGLMYWHLGFALGMLILFSAVTVHRYRHPLEFPGSKQLGLLAFAGVLLIVSGHLGASLVFRHGAGVNPEILAPEIRDGHTHQNGHSLGSNNGDSQKSAIDSHNH